jgi:hypothetical protein
MFRTPRPIRMLALALGVTMNTAALAADVLVFNDFSSTAGLQINGHAAQGGNVLRVTPAIDNRAGSVFSTNAVSLADNASFSTAFSFRFSNPDQGFCDGGPVCGADGLVFVLQTVSNSVGGVGWCSCCRRCPTAWAVSAVASATSACRKVWPSSSTPGTTAVTPASRTSTATTSAWT